MPPEPIPETLEERLTLAEIDAKVAERDYIRAVQDQEAAQRIASEARSRALVTGTAAGLAREVMRLARERRDALKAEAAP